MYGDGTYNKRNTEKNNQKFPRHIDFDGAYEQAYEWIRYHIPHTQKVSPLSKFRNGLLYSLLA